MRYFPVLPRLVAAASGIVLLSGLPACRKSASAALPAAVPVDIAPELLANGLASSPSTFLADQASSPVHWQPWSRETLERARRADRLVFAVFALPQQAESLSVLKAIHAESSLVSDLNSNFVPVLVDSDACRETGLLAASLCSEIKQPFSMPLFVWMTPDGNPVAWIPAKARKGGLRELCEQSSSVVARMWRESAESHAYILGNSKSDNAARAERLAKAATLVPAADAAQDGLRAIRQLSSFYDAGSHSFDNAGGLFPAAGLEVFSSALLVKGIPADIAGRCREASEGLSEDLSSSAMLDPLDGCIYSARWGGGWDLPSFTRDCPNHARALVALACAARTAKQPQLVHQLIAGLNFAEKNYAASEGLFALGRQDLQPRENWLWSLDQLEKALSPEELKVWTAVSGLKNLGNIPAESDPNRDQFRRNSLAVKVAPETVAAKLGLTPEVAREQFESGRRKILKLRQDRGGAADGDSRPHAVATFRMVSAYAAAFSLTGDPVWKKKAVETFDRACGTFGRDSELRLFPGKDDIVGEGRAFLYGVAIQAGLDVAEITLDPAPVDWSEKTATTAGKFLEGANLREVVPAAALVDVPVADRTMIYDDSSAGLLAGAEARLSRLGRKLPEAYATAVVPLPKDAVDSPIVHADLLQAFLMRQYAPVVLVAPDAAPALKEAVCRLPLRMALRRMAAVSDEVPAGQVKILFPDGTSKAASTPDMLGAVILAGGPAR
ncbi:DUF255 domain-containing protein [Luteolibacter ambystomatis]|uniref:DUF255 domain-containing protein n=1 Tax=Luteolibacter ambystomatis TaxID=2824561 RepID=A0A975G9Q1_9BACT|nr:DUF255 domain-containing protein [Luteolibacter ambystomatis]QUE51305.1 DUF255 domain-containing protein [Luteolibacter ambystomatis]